jgi:hypothetical protein
MLIFNGKDISEIMGWIVDHYFELHKVQHNIKKKMLPCTSMGLHMIGVLIPNVSFKTFEVKQCIQNLKKNRKKKNGTHIVRRDLP